MENIADILTSKTAAIAIAFVVLFALERVFPVVKWVGGSARVVKNFALAVINFVASPLIVIPFAAWASAHAWDWRPELWSGVHGFVFDLLLLDLWIYGWHRINHRLPFLWRFHEVHHLDEMLDTTSALRFHFGEVLLSSVARALVILLLAMPLASVVAFEAIILVSALFHHSNIKLPRGFEKALSYVIVTPSIHWVHHHAVRRDTDSNYATVLSIWDRLFASRSLTDRFTEMPIGVEQQSDRSFLQLVLRPFSR